MHRNRGLLAVFVVTVMGLATTSAWAQMQSGSWEGWHQCVDGRIPTQANINVDGTGMITGSRQFKNPKGSGSFAINGAFQANTGEVWLYAGDWIVAPPPGFLKCDLIGRLDASGSRITGSSPGCPCGTFELTLQQTAAGGCCSWTVNGGRTCGPATSQQCTERGGDLLPNADCLTTGGGYCTPRQ